MTAVPVYTVYSALTTIPRGYFGAILVGPPMRLETWEGSLSGAPLPHHVLGRAARASMSEPKRKHDCERQLRVSAVAGSWVLRPEC